MGVVAAVRARREARRTLADIRLRKFVEQKPYRVDGAGDTLADGRRVPLWSPPQTAALLGPFQPGHTFYALPDDSRVCFNLGVKKKARYPSGHRNSCS
jgi:hypothetical protein